MVRILRAHGIEVVLPEQRASGIPEMLYGYANAARQAAEFNVNAMLPWIQRGAVLLTAEPTASFAFKVHYPDYLASLDCSAVSPRRPTTWESSWSATARDHPEAAPEARPFETLGPRCMRVAYHQPCHLKAQGRSGTPAWNCSGRSPAWRSSTWPQGAAAWPAPSG